MSTVDINLPAALAELQSWAETERLGPSVHVAQSRIDAFAEATGDHNWIHVDSARAQAELPGGQTIAHGFLLLSLTVEQDVAALVSFAGINRVLNYGLNKVRFLAPVPSGSDVRVRSRFHALECRQSGQWLLTQHKTVELQPSGAVALVAEHLALLITEP